MSKKQQFSHLSVHSISYVDKAKNARVEIPAGRLFNPSDDLGDIDDLVSRGAVREATAEDNHDAAVAEAESRSGPVHEQSPAGYARGTTGFPQTAAQEMQVDQVEADAESRTTSADAKDNLPGSRSTKR